MKEITNNGKKQRQPVTDQRVKKNTFAEVKKINAIANRFLRQQKTFYKLHDKHLKFLKYSVEKIDEKIIELKKIQSFLTETKKTHESLEDTVLNILLAIRQNEYLQAWYPAQNGYDQMKVIGSHPQKLKNSGKNGIAEKT